MRLLKNLLVSLLAVLMLAMLAVYLTPLDAYVPRVEQALSTQLHEPVDIGRISLAALPLPHLELQGVRLGTRELIAAQSVDAELDLFSLLEGKAVVRRILVRDGAAHLAAVRKLAEVFADPAAIGQGIEVRELELSRMSLLLPSVALGPIDGKLAFGRTGHLQSVSLAMDEQRLAMNLVPMPERRLYIQVQAHDWAPPQWAQFPQLALWKMDSLQLEGVLSEQKFIVLKFGAVSRGISLAGSGSLEFSNGWQVKAKLSQADAQLEQVMAVMGVPVDLTGMLSATGQVSAKAKTPGELKENLKFDGEVHAAQVSVPVVAGFTHPMVFDEIRARLAAEPAHVSVSGLQARLYGGRMAGGASIDRKKLVLEAEFSANGIDLRPLVEALTNEVLATGTVDGATRLAMRLDGFERFPENMRATGNFHMRNGTLTKVDLVQAASNPGAIYTKGGATRFDDLTGLFNVDAAGYHFRQVKISSGSLNADGRLDIAPSWQLKGSLETDIKGTAGLVSMPMVVSGTVSNPVVMPSGSALAGAAVGTAILGPGLGTAVGIKLGGFLNKLFGKNEDKNDTGNVPSPK